MAKKIIYKILSVTATILKTNPPKIRIVAKGQVTSTGWKNPSLLKYIYVHQPFDGVQDYSFMADAPTGIVLPVITPISLTTTVPYESWMKGVRIHATTNSKTVKWGSASSSSVLSAAKKAPAKKAPAKKAAGIGKIKR